MDLSEIKDRIVERRGYEDAAKKGTQKGVEFEDACEPYIRSTAEAYSYMVESIGSAAGDLGSRILYGNRSDAGAQRTKILMSIVIELKIRKTRLICSVWPLLRAPLTVRVWHSA